MHVGCCENCRFIDLVEGNPDGCPRCGGKLVSLNVDSVHWNRLNPAGKRMLVMQMLTEPQLRPMTIPEFELEPEQKDEVVSKLVKKADDRDVQVRHAENEILESRKIEKDIRTDQQKLIRSVINEKKSKQKYAFICSKCDCISYHVRHGDKYLCPECGSLMLDAGYKADAWSALSEEDRRKITSETQYRFIVKSIRKDHR
ncbi:MAG: hypothetical protein K6F73_07150 [Lachnospiraceae bacterium]|nr:hypothetical protein [Lachnospiraceae bacterium]